MIRRMTTLTVCLILCAASAAAQDGNKELETRITEYKKLSKALIKQAVAGKIDQKKAKTSIDKLIEHGKWFCTKYQERYPECKKMMQIVIDNAESMQKLELAKVEELWHDNGIFNEKGNELDFDIDDEDAEDYHNPKDAVVHPATVTILLRRIAAKKGDAKEAYQQIKVELAEVVEHINMIKHSLRSK